MNTLAEFFESDEGRGSMTRLMIFLSFWPATFILVINYDTDSIDNLFAIYLGAYVLGYIGGKGADAFNRRQGQVE